VSVRRIGATTPDPPWKDPYGSLLTPPEVLVKGLPQVISAVR